MAGAIARGLSVQDFYHMTIGQIVDYCIEHNNLMSPEKDDKPIIRQATQADWDNF